MWRNLRRSVAAAVCVATALTAGCAPAGAPGSDDAFPQRDITVVVPWEPGGGSDLIARALAPCMSRELGTDIVVQNVTGASGRIGTFQVYDADPDGYVIGMLEPYTLTIAALTGRAGDRDPKRLSWLAQISAVPMTLVAGTASGLDSLDDLRGRPVRMAVTQVSLAATLTYLPLLGATPELVYYDGGSEAMLATVRGDVEAAVQVAPTVVRAIGANEGALQALAVLADERVADLPDVPTTEQAGAPLTDEVAPFARYSYAFAAPPDTPAPVLQRLEAAIAAAAADDACAADVARAKLAVVYEPAAQVTQLMQPFADGLAAIRDDLLRAAGG